MARHPAHCDCEGEDPRIVKCENCGCDLPETVVNCPHCSPLVLELKAIKRSLIRIGDIYRMMYAAHIKADEKAVHNAILDLGKEIDSHG
jgi:hypothetical protein